VSAEPAVVAQGGIGHLRELRDHLLERGIHAQVVRPPEGRGSA
jgi:hypothetical protein